MGLDAANMARMFGNACRFQLCFERVQESSIRGSCGAIGAAQIVTGSNGLRVCAMLSW